MRPPTLALAGATALAISAGAAPAQEAPAGSGGQMARVVESIEELNDLRERLAKSFLDEGGIEPDRETFAAVCRPVGKRAAALSSEHGWTVQQMAVRYRNPAHRPDATARRIHRKMEADPNLLAHWRRDTLNGTPGLRYFRRITVRDACLECHGAKEERPGFVVERYPEDRAFGFQPGDLRGVYSVFVPEALLSDDPSGPPPDGP